MITIYGASDDLIEVDGDIREEFSEPCGSWTAVIASADGREAIRVSAEYIGSTWQLGAGPASEEQPMPGWPVRVRQGTAAECSYSAVLEIDAPAGAHVCDHGEDGDQ